MPKAVPLGADMVATPQPAPQAAASPRAALAQAATPPEAVEQSGKKSEQVPLQVRLPRDQAKAIRVAAAEREQTISEFMLACFHAFMDARKNG